MRASHALGVDTSIKYLQSPWDGDVHQSEERNFAMVADSAAGHLHLSPMVFMRCHRDDQPENTTEVSPLQGF